MGDWTFEAGVVRLFCGVFPPVAVAAQIGAQLDALELPRGRWVQDAQLHLTLTFFGEMQPSTLPDLRAAIDRASAAQASFELELGEFDAFPALARARVGFLRARRGGEELTRLAAALAAELPAGLRPPQQHEFHAHLTLVRFAAPPPGEAMQALSAQLAQQRFRFEVRRVDLMRSELDRAGAHYRHLHASSLQSPN